jgi:hypothetical protein
MLIAQTHNLRLQPQIFNETVRKHRNRLNGCFPPPEAHDPDITLADRVAETAANG